MAVCAARSSSPAATGHHTVARFLRLPCADPAVAIRVTSLVFEGTTGPKATRAPPLRPRTLSEGAIGVQRFTPRRIGLTLAVLLGRLVPVVMAANDLQGLGWWLRQ
jgi:hypothetical protein